MHASNGSSHRWATIGGEFSQNGGTLPLTLKRTGG
jgi:hypothetical protein